VDLTELVQGLDGDILDIDWTPSTYAPDSGAAEASDDDDLAAHLKGIDDELGSISSSGGGLTWQTISSNTTASVDSGYLVDNSGVVLTLPSSPTDGDVVAVAIADSSADDVLIDGNSIPVEGSSFFILDGQAKGVYLVYSSGENTWRFVLNEYKIALDIGNDGTTEEDFVNEITSENEPSSSILTNPSASEARFDWSNITSIAGVGNFELIETITASSQSTVDFTTGIDNTYKWYELVCIGVRPSNDTVGFYLRTSSDGGLSWDSGSSDYDWTFTRNDRGSLAGASSDGDSKIEIILDSGNEEASNVSGHSVNTVISIFNPSDSGLDTQISHDGNYYKATADFPAKVNGGGSRQTASAVDGVRLLFSSGNISTGIFKLYGVA
jgi:hypothetical protein